MKVYKGGGKFKHNLKEGIIYKIIPQIIVALREAAMMSWRAAIIPAAVFTSLGLAGPKTGDLISLASRASLARITVYRVVAEG